MYNMHAAVQQDYHKLLIYMMSTVNPRLSFDFFFKEIIITWKDMSILIMK